MLAKCRPTTRKYRKQWAQKLRLTTTPPCKPPHMCVKPKHRVKCINWCLPNLYSIAQFLHEASPEGPPCMIVEKVPETRAVYVIGTTLYVHPLHLCKKDKLKFILLATHLHLVNEVRIHNFHIDFFLTAKRFHVRITLAY